MRFKEISRELKIRIKFVVDRLFFLWYKGKARLGKSV